MTEHPHLAFKGDRGVPGSHPDEEAFFVCPDLHEAQVPKGAPLEPVGSVKLSDTPSLEPFFVREEMSGDERVGRMLCKYVILVLVEICEKGNVSVPLVLEYCIASCNEPYMDGANGIQTHVIATMASEADTPIDT